LLFITVVLDILSCHRRLSESKKIENASKGMSLDRVLINTPASDGFKTVMLSTTRVFVIIFPNVEENRISHKK
jgi:hypothetical protein